MAAAPITTDIPRHSRHGTLLPGTPAVDTMAWYTYSSSSSSSSSSECGDDPAKEEYGDLDLNDISMLPAGSHGPQDGAVAEPTDDSRGADSSSDESEEPKKMSARAYQLEMLEESLKQNIIVTV